MGHNSCPKCGAGISGGGKKCGSCGAVSSIRIFLPSPPTQVKHSRLVTEADQVAAVNDAGMPSVINPNQEIYTERQERGGKGGVVYIGSRLHKDTNMNMRWL